ncbi:hypothetical protein NP493_2552g00003 [Ridgeia piscesae]|uniref:Uncharacterized protein n=1 Tax=Ridgeia piscesae TaxID=27915 RepID=A0AAD9JFD0_RIDPI|nr:hypothetical protein NP493_2552g00003 [Ridgeia piscesae]
MSTTLGSRTLKATSTWDTERYSTRDKHQDKEIQRRITAGWIAFAKHRNIFKGNIGTCLKRKVYHSCVFRPMIYGAETRALTTQAQIKLAAAQTKFTYWDRKPTSE